MIRTRILFSILCALLPACLISGQDEQEVRRYHANAQPSVSFEIIKSKKPVFPQSAKQQRYDEGEVVYALYVDQFGQLSDYLLLRATHLDFAKAVEKVLPEWEFSAPSADGESTAIVSTLRVNFQRGGGVVYETAGVDIVPYFSSRPKDATAYRIYALWELDRIPVPIEIVKPDFHTALLEDRDLLNAVFEFYIDTNGNVRMPTLREADDRIDERLLVIAQNALLQWKFAPPTVDKQPVVARAAQPFRFSRGKERGSIE